MDLFADLGHLALASRLKRLAERLQQEVSEVYAEQEVGFRARWFPVLAALARQSPQAISELAARLGLTHTAIAQIAQEMERARLVGSRADARDGRRRLLALTRRGAATVRRLAPLWEEIGAATAELVAETGHDLLAALGAVEERLARRSMADRLRARLGAVEVEIAGWRPELAPAFRDLNRAWLEPLFGLEEEDRRVLDDPEGEVLARGGAVLFALRAGEAVGACALLRHGDAAELTKMAVAEPWRGRGIGRRLALAAVEEARALSCRSLFLLTSPRLEAAVALYRALGFQPVDQPPVPHPGFTRCSIVMTLALDHDPTAVKETSHATRNR
ncbi:MAG TPA: bifunctional helix-turn-helix transcriptional regulator/GNAT family N-acetyltransferase [Thermoanaerobaculia bacterium]|nr:bifunctional helix-turn-helix transcriptional regulator/GNAT family N-acetyltransferase [Thermoanaerobaculia bacterium]